MNGTRSLQMEDLSPKDRFLFNQFGRGACANSPFSIVHHAIEHNADDYPHMEAVRRHDGSTVTYSELEHQANVLSNTLVELGLLPRQRVCLVFQRSIEMIVSILAVLKSGCQYVPLDGGIVSDEALRHIFKDTEAAFVLCLTKFENRVQTLASQDVTVIPVSGNSQFRGAPTRPQHDVHPSDGAYVIYTSGTTGRPKGVDVAHLGVTNTLCLQPSSLGITLGTKVAQVLSVSFDMGVWEILGTLMHGGTLCLRGSNWTQTLSQVEVLIATPSILSKFHAADYPNIKTIAVGGEPCPQQLADEWAKNARFYNVCGPTEISILNTAHLHTPGLPLSIGKPNPNTNIYILNEKERPVPVGSIGSMWVGGRGVSRGYVNLPKLTSSRYKSDKFANDGSKMFNTGDLGRWREDGSLEHHGRNDDQVKIKGFRVELDGVSAAIERHPDIIKACALVSDGELCSAYSAPFLIDEETLTLFASKELPYYATPTKWLHIGSIPLTPNGKIDKRALKSIISEKAELPTKLIAPPSVVEKSDVIIKVKEEEEEVESRNPSWSCDSTTTDSIASEEELVELPAKKSIHGLRWLRYSFLSVYRCIFSVVFLANVVGMFVLIHQSSQHRFAELPYMATATAANILTATLVRNEHVVNILFLSVSCLPTWMPLFIRCQAAKIYHLGGLHSGCAIAAVCWFLLLTIRSTANYTYQSTQCTVNLVALFATYLVLVLLLVILAMAHPILRFKFHNTFELTHRFVGWTAIGLVWIQTILVTDSLRGNDTLGHALLANPALWLLAVSTASIIYPWLFLRRVAVRPEVLSSHAIRLHFTYCTPRVGSGIRLSNSPLKEWHAFATINEPGKKGFSVIVSNAGDWTKACIEKAPTQIWKRGLPAAGVLAIAPLFKKIVLVATGSGIGPCLPVIIAKRVPCRVVWSTPHPVKTFGSDIVHAVTETDPDAIIWNTRTQGKPDLALIAYQVYLESGAEAICVISNKKLTTKIVYDLEKRGVPAFGPIWDS